MNVKTVTKEQLSDAIRQLRQNAEQARINAGYGGSWNDGGASDMEEIADTASVLIRYVSDNAKIEIEGLSSTLQDVVKEYLRQSDPEYQKYLELKEKFEE